MNTLPQEQHTELVRSLKKSGESILDELTPIDCDLLHMAVGVSGEAGELLDAVKKITIYRKPADRANVIEELGDLEFFIEGIRQILGISRDECLIANRVKLLKRYHEKKFSNLHAQQRADKTEGETA